MPYTRHGHYVEHGPLKVKPQLVARCGGPAMCSACAKDVSQSRPAGIITAGAEPDRWSASSDPRALLDDIEATIADAADERTSEEVRALNWYSVRPITALRDILDAIDLVTELAPNAQPPAVPVSVLRKIITTALEAK